MPSEKIFHILFIISFLGSGAIRSIFGQKSAQPAEKVEWKESKFKAVSLIILTVGYSIFALSYMVKPAWWAWATFSLPLWARWIGVVLTIGGMPLLAWVQWSLGQNFAAVLHIREGHTLVTDGPYRFVRHPMYSLIFLYGLGLLLLTANWLIGLPMLLGAAAFIIPRVGKEEALMLEQFGDNYKEYMERTGRFLPRLF